MKSELLDKYYASVTQRRGIVINETVTLERMIDFYIASHFCKEEKLKQELMELIISGEKLMYRNKQLIFKILLPKKVENEKLIKNIETIGKQRNIFAHCQVDTSKKALKIFTDTKEDVITLISYKNGIKPIKYTKAGVNKILDLLFDSMQHLIKLNGNKII